MHLGLSGPHIKNNPINQMECWGCRLATGTPARTCCTAAPEIESRTAAEQGMWR